MKPENKNPGPWGGLDPEDVDRAGREALERELDKTSRVAVEVAELTESLKKTVREGGRDAGIVALDEIFFPITIDKYRESPLALVGFVTTVLEEVGKKHGWSAVNALLDNPRIAQHRDPLKQLLQQKDTGWQK